MHARTHARTHARDDLLLTVRVADAVLVYLNADWQPEHGGMLRIHHANGASVDVAPMLDRAVVYCDATPTRTRPCALPTASLPLTRGGFWTLPSRTRDLDAHRTQLLVGRANAARGLARRTIPLGGERVVPRGGGRRAAAGV